MIRTYLYGNVPEIKCQGTQCDRACKWLVQMDYIEFGPMIMSFEIKDWNRSDEYSSIGRENDVRQVRFWNLDSTISNGIQESLIQSEIVFNPIGTSQFEVARLIHGNSARTRLRFNQEIFHKRFKNSFFNYTTVKQHKKSFYRSNGRLQINTKGYSPFISIFLYLYRLLLRT